MLIAIYMPQLSVLICFLAPLFMYVKHSHFLQNSILLVELENVKFWLLFYMLLPIDHFASYVLVTCDA